MHNPLLLTAVICFVVLVWLSRWLFGYLRLKLALARPFPEIWLDIIRRRMSFYEYMPEDLQQQLHTHVRTFLWHKRFIGCAGLEVTDEMRVVIAAYASLLLLNRPTLKFRNVRWIYLYPSEFVARHTVEDATGVTSEVTALLNGEAWSNGRVILAWDDIDKSARDFNGGRNVVLHEFAHQLDGESGYTNGAPLLYSKGAYGTWATVMSREFESLRGHAYFGESSVLDTYGATSPAEFFAVATESFFEEPDALAKEYPDLYEELKKYFQVDPCQWKPAPPPEKSSKGGATDDRAKTVAAVPGSPKNQKKTKKKSKAPAAGSGDAKASKAENGTGVEASPAKTAHSATSTHQDRKGSSAARAANIQPKK